MIKYWWIGVGGFLGANLRYLVQGWAANRWGASFPYGTLLANVIGSFILGFFLTLITQRVSVAPEWRLFVAIGILGGFTTFSSFSIETLVLIEGGSWLGGSLNLVANVFLGLLAGFAGIVLGRML